MHVLKAIAIVLALTAPLLSQDSLRIAEASRRPVAEALDEIERISGVPVHYEDLRYDHPDDVEDVSERVWNPKNQTPIAERRRVIVPKTRTLSFTIGVDERGLLEEEGAVQRALSGLTAAATAEDLPGRFESNRYDRDGRSDLFLLPSAMRGRDGAQRASFAVLATPIRVSTGQTTAAEALGAIMKRISETTGRRVEIGTIPFEALAWASVSLSGELRPAGYVLADLLAQLQGRFSMRLFYDPGVESYALNIRPVRPPGWSPLSPATQAQPPPGGEPAAGTSPSGNPWFGSTSK